MGKWMPGRLSLLFVVVCATVVVATGSSVSGPDRRLRGYSRLLRHELAAPARQVGSVTDCLMEQTLLRRQSGWQQGLPVEQFEALRGFCRNAALLDAQRAKRDADAAKQEKSRDVAPSSGAPGGSSKRP
jgi:hypothetical protein